MNYIFNSSIAGIEDADLILLVGTNPRHEASILNARIRKTFVQKKIPIFSIGNPGDLTYEYEIIGDSTEDIKKIVNGVHDFSQKLLSAKKPIIIIGESALELKSGGYIFEELKNFLTKNNLINENWNGLNILVQNASTVGLLDLKIIQDKREKSPSFFDDLKNRKFKLLYLLGSDNLEFQKNDEFIVYQGSHGDRGAEIADLILPSATYTEQNGFYENLEGRIQEGKKASYPIGEALEDWKIFNRIIKKLNIKEKTLNFDELRKEILETVPNFSEINELPKKSVIRTNNIETSFFNEKISARELDYYYTNSISRSSKTMSECRQIRQKIKKDGTNN
jgi:NADH-quinone oxidoreductase subunit G